MDRTRRYTRPSRIVAGRVAMAGLATLATLHAAPAAAQVSGVWGRVSFAASASSAHDGDADRAYTELLTTFTLASRAAETGGSEFGVDVRLAGYTGTYERPRRESIYEAYFGQRFAGGRLGVRGGQMWLNDLGALGLVGGVHVEYRQPQAARRFRLRVGAFGGYEPKILDAGYVPDVKKYGAYAALDGGGAWRHVVGFVTVRNQDLTEREVLTFTNFLPIGKSVFVYQAGEYHLSGPAGNGEGGLNYFFINGRATATKFLEVQADYHRGRSVDARTITLDVINGRPVSTQSLQGMLYESAGARVTANITPQYRVYASYYRDRVSQDDRTSDRVGGGFFTPNLVKTGIDLGVSGYHYTTATSSFDSWDVTAGRSFGSRVYASGGFTSSLSVLKVVTTGEYIVENRPRTSRYFGSGTFYLTRRFALLATAEYLKDGTFTDTRWMTHLSYRF